MLHVFCKLGQVDALTKLLGQKVDVNVKNKVAANFHDNSRNVTYRKLLSNIMHAIEWVDMSGMGDY